MFHLLLEKIMHAMMLMLFYRENLFFNKKKVEIHMFMELYYLFLAQQKSLCLK